MDAHLLSSPPVSGQCTEISFDAGEENAFVKFEDGNYLDYCGVFGGGDGSQSAIVRAEGIAFVIAFGQGYIFDIDARSVLHKTDCTGLSGAMACERLRTFVSHSHTNIFAYDHALVWASERVASDGIVFRSMENVVLTGEAYQWESWKQFRLDLREYDLVWVEGRDAR